MQNESRVDLMKAVRLLLTTVVSAIFLATFAAEQFVDSSESLTPSAGSSYVAVSLLPTTACQYPSRDYDVTGCRLNLLVGWHRTVNGVDFGTLANWADGEMNGFCLAGIGNASEAAAFGVYIASICNYCEQGFAGIELALLNTALSVEGVQLGLVNAVSEGHGLQMGLFNMAESFCGLQLGLINLAHDFTGLQFGLGNVIGNSPLTACILVNAHF